MSRIRLFFTFFSYSALTITCTGHANSDYLSAEFLTAGQAAIELSSPLSDKATTQNPTLIWSTKEGISLYKVEISSVPDFSQIILAKEVSGNSYTVLNSDLVGLAALDSVQYYWRVSVAKIKTNLVSITGLLQVLGSNTIYVDTNTSSSLQIGNKTSPIKKIQQGIDVADSARTGDASIAKSIFVAKGSYSEVISIKPGISIYGGYEAAGWTRNISGNATTVTASSDLAFIGKSDVTAAYTVTTVIDGFTVNGGSLTTIPTYGFYLLNASPTISNNTIGGGSGTFSYGIFAAGNTAVVISNNSIHGGSATGTTAISYGISVTSTAAPTVTNNTVNGGNPAGTSADSYGMLIGGDALVSANTVSGGNPSGGSGDSHGISLSGGSPIVINNVINSGTGVGNSHGIQNGTSATGIISNNTITGFVAIYTSGAGAVITNNIMYTRAGGYYGVWEFSNTSDPGSLQNNLIIDCPTALYRDEITISRTTEAALNNPASTTQGTAASSSGNLGPTTVANFAAVNFVSASDLHLTASSPVGVRTGGKDTSQSTCGAAGTSSCGNVTTDRDGKARTLPYSMGAYEQD